MKTIKKLFLCFFTLNNLVIEAAPLLIIKIPTRSRPHKFFRTLDKFYQHLSYKIPYKFLITCDEDDITMNNSDSIRRLKTYPHLEFNFYPPSSKVDAFNKDVDSIDFDIVLAAHDDMEPIVKNFDQIIVEHMLRHFPDFDGVLNFNDGFVGSQCNTMPIIGKKFYKRFGYVYNPAYKALVCNVELSCVSKILRKERVVDQVIIKHNHPAWGAGQHDDLYQKNEAYHTQDLITFINRRSLRFDLSEQEILLATPKLWSILICTIEGREESFSRLCNKLKKQTKDLGLETEIEILACKDKKGEHSIGYKRNQLLAESQGKYISFIDDDDDIHDHYIKMITEKLAQNPDCVSLTGIITFNGINPKKFVHSINYKNYFEDKNIYFRPPNHLNPIKRYIAVQFSFPEINFEEDTNWAMQIAKSELLQKEEVIDIPYYFYLCKTS